MPDLRLGDKAKRRRRRDPSTRGYRDAFVELAARVVFGFLALAVFRAVEPVFAAAARFFVAVALRAGLFVEAFARRTGFLAAAGTE